MKKLLARLVRRKSGESEPRSRITNDTVAEHRERILAGGRKFKYPLQYAKHKLVINAVIISVVAIVALISIGWWQLYSLQNTSEFMYKVTQVLPLPVASVDGQLVPYSDYLMKYRSSEHYLEVKEQVNLSSDDGKLQVETIKQQAMDDAVSDAYALKLAKSLNVTISDTELEAFLKSQRQSSEGEVSQQTYDAVILDYYNWGPDEYRHVTKSKLLKQAVIYAVDSNAQSLVEAVNSSLNGGANSDLKSIADNTKAADGVRVTFGQSGRVPKSNQDGGLTSEAAKLSTGKVSTAIKTVTADAYYFVKLTFSNDTQVEYDYIKIPLSTFNKNLASLKSDGKVKYYISLAKPDNP